jgi:putative transposase
MPYIKVYIHFVWTTQNHNPVLVDKNVRAALFSHIKENAKKKEIFIDRLAVQKEHCHCLISLGKDQTLSNLMFLIKGESSFWLNQQKMLTHKFKWQKEYFAVSVSESVLPRVRNYIMNQDEHHRNKSFSEEYEEFITKYGFVRIEDDCE